MIQTVYCYLLKFSGARLTAPFNHPKQGPKRPLQSKITRLLNINSTRVKRYQGSDIL